MECLPRYFIERWKVWNMYLRKEWMVNYLLRLRTPAEFRTEKLVNGWYLYEYVEFYLSPYISSCVGVARNSDRGWWRFWQTKELKTENVVFWSKSYRKDQIRPASRLRSTISYLMCRSFPNLSPAMQMVLVVRHAFLNQQCPYFILCSSSMDNHVPHSTLF